MSKRFSDNELFDLRNRIPIDTLIKKLMVPSKFSEGFFRFLCPICNEFQTATNPKTNLARCFRCERNFNTIDMVIIYKKMGFVESVKYLKTYRKTISNNDSICKESVVFKETLQKHRVFETTNNRSQNKSTERSSCPTSLGKILDQFQIEKGTKHAPQ